MGVPLLSKIPLYLIDKAMLAPSTDVCICDVMRRLMHFSVTFCKVFSATCQIERVKPPFASVVVWRVIHCKANLSENEEKTRVFCSSFLRVT